MIFIFILLIINAVLSKYRSKVLIILNFAVLLLIAGFRDITIGTDTVNYSEHYHLISHGASLGMEPLWSYLIKIVIYFGGSFQTLLIVSTILTLLPVFYVIYQKSPYPLLSIFLYITLYYYFYSFNIIRQCIGMSFGLLSISFFIDKRKLVSLSFFLIALFFHYSSIILIPGFLFIGLVKSRKSIIHYLIILTVCFIVGLFFGPYLLSFTQRFIYTNYIIDHQLNFAGNFVYLIIINALFIFVFTIIKERDKWFQMFFIYVILVNLFSRIPFGNRFTMFYGICSIIFLPMLLKHNKLKTKEKNIVFAALFAIGLLSLYINWGSGEILPYKNVLF